MHFEFLVEDASGKIVAKAVVSKILGKSGEKHSYRIFSFRGIGRLPSDLREKTDPKKHTLLNKLPALLRGYGKSLSRNSAVVVIVDLDKRSCVEFKKSF